MDNEQSMSITFPDDSTRALLLKILFGAPLSRMTSSKVFTNCFFDFIGYTSVIIDLHPINSWEMVITHINEG